MRKHRATCCTSTKKECRISRTKNNWQNCVQMQDLSKQLALDNPSWRRILMNSWDLMVMRVVENIHFFETTNHQLQKDGFVGNWKLVLHWKLWPNTIKECWWLRSESSFYPEMDLIRGSEFRTVSTNSWETWRKRHEFLVRMTRMIQIEQGHLLSKKRESWNILGLRQTNMEQKAKPKPTSAPPSAQSQKSIPIQERNWIDVEPREHAQKGAQSFTISTKMIALLRHGTRLRDQDGAMEFWRLKEEFKVRLPNFYTLVNSIAVRSFENRRRTQEDISTLY